MMTRKHYEMIAEEINKTADICHDDATLHILELTVDGLCRRFKADNPAFDAKRFKAACFGL